MIYGKGLSRTNPPTPDMLGLQVNKMLKLCPFSEGMIPAAMTDRRNVFSRLKKTTGFTPNWFLPPHLGGYGLDIRALRGKLVVTPEQRRVAAWMILHPDSSCLYSFRASADFDLQTLLPLCLNEWLFCGKVGILPLPKIQNLSSDEDLLFQAVRKMFGEEEIPNYSQLEFEELTRSSTAITDQLNQWKMRFMAMENARKVHDRAAPILVPHAKAAMLKRTWISPVSDEGLSRYWNPFFITTALPDCPPLRQIPFPKDYVRYCDRRNLIITRVADVKGKRRDPLGIMGIDYHWKSGEGRLGFYESVIPEDLLPFIGEGQEDDRPDRFGLLAEEMSSWREEDPEDLDADDGIVLEDFP
jgi:hypothetical protein